MIDERIDRIEAKVDALLDFAIAIGKRESSVYGRLSPESADGEIMVAVAKCIKARGDKVDVGRPTKMDI